MDKLTIKPLTSAIKRRGLTDDLLLCNMLPLTEMKTIGKIEDYKTLEIQRLINESNTDLSLKLVVKC